MAEFPALPLFTDALIADTQHLTEEEFGAYLRLLIKCWRTPGCRMPVEDAWHMRMHSIDSIKFNRLFKPLLVEFFTKDRQGNYYFQKRLTKEFLYVQKVREKNTVSAKARWNKEKEPCARNAPHPTPPTVSVSKDTDTPPTPTEKKSHDRPKRSVRKSSLIDDGFAPDLGCLKLASDLGFVNGDLDGAIKEFIDYWKSCGRPMSDWQAAFRNRLRQLAKYRAERLERKNDGRRDVQDVVGATLRVIKTNQHNQA